MGILLANIFVGLFSKTASAEQFQTLYGASFSRNIRPIVYFGLIVTIFSLIISLIITVVKNKFKKVKFDYKNEYQKFKPKSKVKITFMDREKEVTKKVRIISIDAKGISFEDKENVYECTPAEIKNIRKKSKRLLALIVTSIIFVLITTVDFIVFYATSIGMMEKYGVAYVTDYGVEWDE